MTKEERRIQEEREERGLLKASSFLHKEVKELIRKNLPLSIDLIVKSHKILFNTMGGADSDIGGRFRKSNGPELERIDGTPLVMADYKNIANEIAILNEELRVKTRNLRKPIKEKQYKNIINLAATLSHRLASIHPFENGNGRASRLLLNAILNRAGLSWLESDVSVHSKKEEKGKYLTAMRQADDGDYSILQKMILESLITTARKQYKQRSGGR